MSNNNVNVNVPSQATMNNSGNALVQNVATIRSGEMPPNAQIQQTFDQTRQALDEAKYEGNLSSKGQILVEDAKAVLDSASRMIAEKNSDQKLQRLVGNGISASHETRGNLQGSTGSIPVGRGDLTFAQGEAREIYNAARELVIFAVRSGQFREMLMELMDLLQTILKSTQDKIATQSDMTKPQDIANQMKNETYFTEENKQSLWNKLRAILMKMGSHPEYYNAVDHLFAIVDQIEEKATQTKAQASGTSAVLPVGRYDQLWGDARSLLEEFSGNGSVDMCTARVNVLQTSLREDAEARALLWEARVYLREVVRQPTLLDDPVKSQKGKELIDRTRWLLQGKHKQQFTDVFDSFKLILSNIHNDSARQDFSQKIAKFVSDFAYDAEGRPDLFVLQQSLVQMKSILVPVLTKQLSNLPIPKIEGSNPKYDFAIDGLLLNIVDLLPDFVNIRTKTDSRMNVQRLKTQKNSAKIVMEVDQIKAFFRDVRFMYRRKKMPRIEDHGIADVDISQGTGISLKMVWKVKSIGNQPLQLKLVRVKCNIARLVITVKQAKHRMVDKIVTKLFAGTIKRQMANAIVNNIIKSVQPLGARLNDLLRRRPTMTGGLERINDGMKSTLFSGNTGEPTTLTKAKGQINTAVHTAKDKVHEMKVNKERTNQDYVLEKHTTAFVQPVTYVETERTTTKKDWNFEWYNPSLQYDSFNTNGLSIPVVQEDTYHSVPVDQMRELNMSNNNRY